MILTEEKHQKYQQFHQEKLINMNILWVKKYCLQGEIIEQTKFAFSPLPKVFEKQAKMIEDQGEKQIKALESRVEETFLDTVQKSSAALFLKDFLNEEATYELNKIVEMENKLNRDNLIYKTGYEI